jgi:MFS family permease
VSGLVAAVFAVPLGSLIDRVNRTRVLAIGIGGWALVMAACAAAQSFVQLVLIRCLLGAAVAVAGPATASLIGDFFSPTERGRIWGYVLTGELVGAGFGFTVAGGLASLSWRASFLSLGLPALALAYVVWRLPEPARGGAGRIPEGAVTVRRRKRRAATAELDEPPEMSHAQRAMRVTTPPYEELVLDEDPRDWSIWQAIRYVLRIRTNVTLIVAGSAGYFFFAGARAFGIEFVKPQYGIGQALASSLTLILGVFAIAGVVLSGWYSDRLGMRGHLRARVGIGAAMLGLATVALIPALLVDSLGVGLVFLGLAVVALAAVNPPVDAGRLDIMPPTLWGRAEAVRTLLKQPAEALAPLLFGVLADHLLGGGQAGLRATFLLMLIPLAAAAVVILHARRTYPRDVATAAASIERMSR